MDFWNKINWCKLFHRWKTTDIHFENGDYYFETNAYADIYTKTCTRCDKKKIIVHPFIATIWYVPFGNEFRIRQLINKQYF